MGKMNGVYETERHTLGTLLFGNNEFRTETLKVAAGADINITDGTVLTRDVDGTLKVATDTTGALFVLADEIVTPITAAGSYAVRVVESGRVDRRKVFLNGTAVSDAQVDDLRKNNILVRTVHEVK